MHLTLKDHLDMRHDMAGVIDRSKQATGEAASILQRSERFRSIAEALSARYDLALLRAGPEGENAAEVVAARADLTSQLELFVRATAFDESRFAGIFKRLDEDKHVLAATERRLCGTPPRRFLRLATLVVTALTLASMAGFPVIATLETWLGL
ncbi:MAG: hypothetical protein V3W41_01645 [Planctomycetota bacterium]